MLGYLNVNNNTHAGNWLYYIYMHIYYEVIVSINEIVYMHVTVYMQM